MKITFLGGGEMATELIGNLFGGGFPVADVKVIETNDERRRQVGEGFGVRTFAAPVSEALDCDILLLAVEPGQIAGQERPAHAQRTRSAGVWAADQRGCKLGDLLWQC